MVSAVRPSPLTVAPSPTLRAGQSVPICLWDLTDGKELRRLVSEGECTQVAFSADGRRILSGHSGGWVRLRDVSNGEEVLSIQTFQGYSGGRGPLARRSPHPLRRRGRLRPPVGRGQRPGTLSLRGAHQLLARRRVRPRWPHGRFGRQGRHRAAVAFARPAPIGARRRGPAPAPAPSSLPAEATKAEALPTSAPPRPSGPKAFAEPIGIKIVPIPSGEFWVGSTPLASSNVFVAAGAKKIPHTHATGGMTARLSGGSAEGHERATIRGRPRGTALPDARGGIRDAAQRRSDASSGLRYAAARRTASTPM